jgi:putative peptidoglycan lipid II flippase
MPFLKSAFIVSFFTGISRILGFVRDILIANFLGAGFFADIFIVAQKIPNLFRAFCAESALSQAFIPIFTGLSHSDREAALKFANNIFIYLSIFLLSFTFLAEIFMPYLAYIFAPGFVKDAEKFSYAVTYSRITFPYLCLISLVSLFSAILNGLGKFAAAASNMVLYNICFIAGIFIFTPYTNNYALSMSYGLLLAGVAQFLWSYYFARREGFKVEITDCKIKHNEKNFFRKIGPAILGSSIVQINSWIDVLIASFISSAVSYLYYAERLVQLPLALIGTAIGTASLPALSKLIQKKQENQVINLQNKAISISLFFAIPAAIALYILAEPIIATLFNRGEFMADEVTNASKALALYAFALPAFILSKILSVSFYAKGDTKTPMKITASCVLLNLILNLILIRHFSFLGIVIATIISSWCNISLLFYILQKNKILILQKTTIHNLIKLLISAIIMGLALYFLAQHFADIFKQESLSRILTLAGVIFSGLVIYITPIFLLKTKLR